MTKRDQSAIVLTVAGVGAGFVGALIAWGLGGALLLLCPLLLVIAFLIGLG